MTVSNGDVLRASARFKTVEDTDVVNVWYFQANFVSDQTDGTVFAAVDTYLTSFYTEWDSTIDNSMTPYDLKVDVVTFSGGDWVVTKNVGFGSWGSGIVPTDGGSALPHGDAVLVKLFTGLGKHTGKKFFGGFTLNSLTANGKVGSGIVAAIATGMAKALVPHVISAGNELATAVLDQKIGTIRQVISVAVSDVFGYQRRRRPGTGS